MLSKEMKVALKAAEQKSDPDLWGQSRYFCWSPSQGSGDWASSSGPQKLALD